MPIIKKIGDHHMELGDDVAFVRFVGDETASDAKTFISLMQEAYGTNPYYVILDSHHIGNVDPEARRIFSAWLADYGLRGAAIYGATVTTRTFVRLVDSLVRLFGRKVIPFVFVKTHQEAVLWVDEQRNKARSQS